MGEVKYWDGEDFTVLDSKDAQSIKGFTVGVNVPANAEFIDTIYTHPSMHPASIITESTSRRFVSDAERGQWNGKTKTITSTTEPNLNTGDQWHKEI